MSGQINRREFIRRTAVVTGGVVGARLGGNFVAAASDEPSISRTRSFNSDMEYRRLGSTGLWVSAVCLGGHFKKVSEVINHQIPNYVRPTDPAALKDFDKNRYDVVSRCIERGINYVDACTEQEVITYSKALQGRRNKMFLGASFWPDCPRKKEWRTAEALLSKLDEGLQKAKLDYVDVWRLTCDTKDGHNDAEIQEFIKAFVKAQEQGKARFCGCSSHSRPWLTKLAENHAQHFQVFCFPYTVRTKEAPEGSLFTAVRKHDVGTFGIKPFGSNSLFQGAKTPEEKSERARMTIRFILGNPAISAPIPGLSCAEQVDNMAHAIKEQRKLSRTEEHELQRVGDEMWANLPTNYQWLRKWEYV